MTWKNLLGIPAPKKNLGGGGVKAYYPNELTSKKQTNKQTKNRGKQKLLTSQPQKADKQKKKRGGGGALARISELGVQKSQSPFPIRYAYVYH